jgi:hypothetical protein
MVPFPIFCLNFFLLHDGVLLVSSYGLDSVEVWDYGRSQSQMASRIALLGLPGLEIPIEYTFLVLPPTPHAGPRVLPVEFITWGEGVGEKKER